MARPREFDPNQVLGEAVEVFWSLGYKDASIDDLVERTKVNRGSLYATFGNKHDLFLAALKRYQDRRIGELDLALQTEKSALAGIRKVFSWIFGDRAFTLDNRGCLMTNSALEMLPGDRDVIRILNRGYKRLEDAFHAALQRARAQGELSDGQDPRGLAGFLVSSIQGMRVIEKVYRDRKKIREVKDIVLSRLER